MASASNRGQGGIQQLLAAEQDAQHIVNAARNAKLARLKQAKDEAEKEIADYRAQVEREFQKKLAASSGDSGANVKRLEVETAEKINHLSTDGSRISGDVVDMLLKHVTTSCGVITILVFFMLCRSAVVAYVLDKLLR